ncbi:MAG: translation initiation factor IF-2 [Chitinophagales bacterium]|nr:MAG: translation initiation factor IF-2 [Chitinophagales bacterium]
MSEVKNLRLVKVASELNVGTQTIIEHLKNAGYDVEDKPTAKLTEEMYRLLINEFQKDADIKSKAEKIVIGTSDHKDIVLSTKVPPPKKENETEEVLIKTTGAQTLDIKEKKTKTKEDETDVQETPRVELSGPKVVGKIDLKPKPQKQEITEKAESEIPQEQPVKETPSEPEWIKTPKVILTGPKVIDKIELPVEKPDTKSKPEPKEPRRKRRRIVKKVSLKDKADDRGEGAGSRSKSGKGSEEQPQISDKEIQEKIRATMAKLGTHTKGKAVKTRIKRQKREDAAEAGQSETIDSNILQVTEFISVSELASLMNVSPTEVISKCLKLGVVVSINQRLNAEVIELVADEFGYKVKFITISDQAEVEDLQEDDAQNTVERAPIVTVMGHVDHGKTSLLDYIRRTNVTSQEAGGITQHIGAYEVTTESGKKIVFLDTPGHEAFTAMRARGASVTDIAVIVIAADDAVMPQTKEAISHAQAAGVPMIFAINKIDKEGANPDKIREQLANMNLLVEEWGGKYQSQEISAKKGINIDKLLDKILLEAELLELKCNPHRPAVGTVIEASLDKGRGYVATLLVQNGTLHIGDVVVAGIYYGKVKAMFNEKGERRTEAGPASAVLILGLNGAPTAGEAFKVYSSEQEAKEVTNRREQILREQGLRTKKHITLDEIGRRRALGTFKELKLIVKADVDGSVQALTDAIQKLSTEEVMVNVVHSAVGQITESDVLLASASDAVIIGFQVRPSPTARKLAEKENIEIRLYSIIYDAIEQIKTAIEGMLEPTIEEKVLGTAEVKELFKVSKVGTIAGCQVIEGKIPAKSKVRVIREGIVVFTGEIDTLKRFKDEVKEVVSGQECGIHLKEYNDVKVGDHIEAYEETEVKRKL